MWISDIKEFYFNIVSAWEILNSVMKGEMTRLDDARGFLHGARSRLAQSASEIRTFNNDKAAKLILSAESNFEDCWDAFYSEFNLLTPTNKVVEPISEIIAISDTLYRLPCSICGKTAVEFKIGYGRFDKEESLVFTGITHSRSFNKSLANELFTVLKNNDLLGVQNFLKKYHGYEGLDAYCPECNKIYCWEHYNAREEFDDGFYDCTYGECPYGHKRMIDD